MKTEPKPNRLYQVTLTNARPVRVSNEDWPVTIIRDSVEEDAHIRMRLHRGTDQGCIVYGWSVQEGFKRSAGYRGTLDKAAGFVRKVGSAIGATKEMINAVLEQLPPERI